LKTSSLGSNHSLQTPPPLRRFQLVVILGSLAMMGPLSIDMYLPALPTIVKDFHTTSSNVQLTLTFFLLGLALGQLIAGPISDVRGRRIPLMTGLLIYTISSLFCAISPSIWSLILLRFVQGLAGAAGIVLSRAIVRDLYSGTQLTKFFTLLMLVNGLGPIIAPLIGGQMLRLTSWHGIFIILSCVGFLMFLTVLMSLKETLPIENRSSGGISQTFVKFRHLFADREFMGYALSQGFVTAALFAYISGSSFVLQTIYGVSPQTYSFIFAINGLGFVVASQITGRLVSRIKEIKLLVSGFVIVSIGGVSLLLVLLMGTGLPWVLPPFFLIVASMGIVGPTTTSLALQKQGKSAGSAAALLGVLSLMFGAFSSPLVGIGGGQTALPLGIVIAVASVSSILCYALFIRSRYKPEGHTL
jgi:MFS transporter, DHA1 family, multidrug resistance protein